MSASEAAAASFQKMLNDNQVSAFVRKSRGGDIGGACGQLAGDVKDRTGAADRMAKQRTIRIHRTH